MNIGKKSTDGTGNNPLNIRLSKRKKKKLRAELRAANAKESIQQETAEKVLYYISKWKHAKSEWKFEKLKQIWLIDNFMNKNYIPDKNFPTILEYFQGCKGSSRKQIIEKSREIIEKVEGNYEKNVEFIYTTEYIRAKQLIQSIPHAI